MGKPRKGLISGAITVSYRKFIFPAMLLAAAAGAGTFTVPTQPAHAQAATNAPTRPPAPPRRERASHIDGRIAFLKAELKITPAQEAQFNKLADAMRQNAAERRQAFEQMRPQGDRSQRQPPNAMQRLEQQAKVSAQRAQQTDRLLAAFRPLYDSLSPDQKKAADGLMAPHFHGRHHHRI
jgi:hypothetical protein